MRPAAPRFATKNRDPVRLYAIGLEGLSGVGKGARVSAALRSWEEQDGRRRVCERLQRSILEGQLAERLGLSRTPVRQAVTMLEVEGLVGIAPNKGAVVCSFSIEDVWDIYDLRAVLEGHAARRAAARIRAGEL